jgi:hypothetical protein
MQCKILTTFATSMTHPFGGADDTGAAAALVPNVIAGQGTNL